ncbi:molybdenum hydroxylase, partial [Thermodesulfobacteriota bacterium]
FYAKRDVHYVLETNRGHDLGRLITEGESQPNTGTPGVLGGQSVLRVIRSPADGVFLSDCSIGDMVKEGRIVGEVSGRPVRSRLDGILRGLIRTGTPVSTGLKIGDVDPRGEMSYCHTVSEKARAIGGSVLEAILATYNVEGLPG